MDNTTILAGAALGGVAIGFAIRHLLLIRTAQKEQQKANQIISDAKEDARELELEAKKKALEIRTEADNEINRRRSELGKEDERLQRRRAELDDRTERMEKREQTLNKRQSSLDRRANELERIHAEALEQLQTISSMTIDEARELLIKEVVVMDLYDIYVIYKGGQTIFHKNFSTVKVDPDLVTAFLTAVTNFSQEVLPTGDPLRIIEKAKIIC